MMILPTIATALPHNFAIKEHLMRAHRVKDCTTRGC